jgi:hypothetical protein
MGKQRGVIVALALSAVLVGAVAIWGIVQDRNLKRDVQSAYASLISARQYAYGGQEAFPGADLQARNQISGLVVKSKAKHTLDVAECLSEDLDAIESVRAVLPYATPGNRYVEAEKQAFGHAQRCVVTYLD